MYCRYRISLKSKQFRVSSPEKLYNSSKFILIYYWCLGGKNCEVVYDHKRPEFEPWLWPKQPGTRYKNKLLACYYYLTTLFSIVFAQTKGELTGVLFQISAHPCDCSRLYCIIFFNRPTLMVGYFDPFCKCVKLENCSAFLNPDHGYTVKRIMPYTVN